MSSTRSQVRNVWPQAVLLIIVVVFAALIGRIVYINAVQGPALRQYARRQQTAVRPLPARRGSIYDRRGRILAGTCQARSLFADPAMLGPDHAVDAADYVESLMDIPAAKVLHTLERRPKSRFVWLARDIGTAMPQEFRFPGLGIIHEPKRIYTANRLACHLLGAVSRDGDTLVGLEGLELKYDSVLGATPGREMFVRDAAGHRIWLMKSEYRPAQDGSSIVLTLDAVIQQFTEDALAAACTKHRASSGIAIVMDPATGDVLAWAVWPAFDPNTFSTFPASTRRNVAVTDPYEPGSIFKPFIAIAALKAGVVKWNETIFCHNGAYRIGRRTLHDHHGYGDLTFQQIVIKSSNIGMGILGERLGNANLYKAIKAFRFGERTGIDLPGEDRGIVRPLRVWNDYSTASVTMGQEIALTGIQLLTAFAGLANDGAIMQPRLLRAVLSETGQIVKDQTKPKKLSQAIEPRYANLMVRNILAKVVSEGTGTRAQIPGYQVFGKTGTAQIARSDGRGYKHRAYVASFLGGAPAARPRAVALVSIREPDPATSYFGGSVAAPAVKSILEKTLRYYRVPPAENIEPGKQVPVAASSQPAWD